MGGLWGGGGGSGPCASPLTQPREVAGRGCSLGQVLGRVGRAVCSALGVNSVDLPKFCGSGECGAGGGPGRAELVSPPRYLTAEQVKLSVPRRETCLQWLSWCWHRPVLAA